METPISYLRERRLLTLDFGMLLILLINLSWMAFDWLFANVGFQEVLRHNFPEFHNWYLHKIHYNFLAIDLVFIFIFLTEFITRWTLAIRRKEYQRWYFYPIFHWYDVLGLIPSGFFRLLRILRVFSILLKMHRTKILDLRKLPLLGIAMHIKDLIVEEITDRVIINLLTAAQNGVKKQNSGDEENVLNKVVTPHREAIINWADKKVRRIAEENYVPNREYLKQLIADNVKEVMENNKSVDELENIPVVGKKLSTRIEHAVGDILFNSLDSLVYTFAIDEDNTAVQEMTELGLDSMLSKQVDEEINKIIETITVDALEEVKAKIEEKQRKDVEQQEQFFLGPN